MPTLIDLTDKPVTLSPEFAYAVVRGTVYVGAWQGPHPVTDEQTLKPGDVLDSDNAFTAFTLDEAQLAQYSQEEDVPKPKAAPKKSKKK